jgi:hypothetical protein
MFLMCVLYVSFFTTVIDCFSIGIIAELASELHLALSVYQNTDRIEQWQSGLLQKVTSPW